MHGTRLTQTLIPRNSSIPFVIPSFVPSSFTAFAPHPTATHNTPPPPGTRIALRLHTATPRQPKVPTAFVLFAPFPRRPLFLHHHVHCRCKATGGTKRTIKSCAQHSWGTDNHSILCSCPSLVHESRTKLDLEDSEGSCPPRMNRLKARLDQLSCWSTSSSSETPHSSADIRAASLQVSSQHLDVKVQVHGLINLGSHSMTRKPTPRHTSTKLDLTAPSRLNRNMESPLTRCRMGPDVRQTPSLVIPILRGPLHSFLMSYQKTLGLDRVQGYSHNLSSATWTDPYDHKRIPCSPR